MPRGKVQPRTGRAVNDSTLDDPAVRDAIDTGRPWALARRSRGPDVQFHRCPPRWNVINVALIAVCLALVVLAFLFWPGGAQ